MGPAPRLALFDCDGTLVDSQHAIVAAMAAAWRSEGLLLPEATMVRRVIGLPLTDAIARLAPESVAAVRDRLADRYRDAHRVLRRDQGRGEPLFPGVREAVLAIGQTGTLLGIATGKSTRGVLRLLEHHELRDLFVTIQTPDSGPSKPHPDMVFRALTETGVEPFNTVVIGDTVFDIEMAHAAGAAALGVSWGYHGPEELMAAGANHLVETPADLPTAVAALLAARS